MFIEEAASDEVISRLHREDNRSWWFGVGKMHGTIGLGDIVQGITWATGIAWLVARISRATGKSCGCKSRQARLNKIRLRLPITYVRPLR